MAGWCAGKWIFGLPDHHRANTRVRYHRKDQGKKIAVVDEGRMIRMDINLLSGQDLVNYGKLCDEDCLERVLDAAGGFREGCFGLGISNKDGIGRALLLVEARPGQPHQVVRFLYDRERHPQDGVALLRMAQTCARVYGIKQMECSYIAGAGQEVLQICGWSVPVTQQRIYRLPGQQLDAWCRQAKSFAGTLLLYANIPWESWIQFLHTVPCGLNHALHAYVPSRDYSFGAMVEGELSGCLFCRETVGGIEISDFKAGAGCEQLFYTFLLCLQKQCLRKHKAVGELQFCVYDEDEAGRLEAFLAGLPYQRMLLQKSVWNAPADQVYGIDKDKG